MSSNISCPDASTLPPFDSLSGLPRNVSVGFVPVGRNGSHEAMSSCCSPEAVNVASDCYYWCELPTEGLNGFASCLVRRGMADGIIESMLSLRPICLLAALALSGTVGAEPFNAFDGPGFPACHDVAASLVRDAAAAGRKVRASGKTYMWYDTMCSDDQGTVIIRTEGVNGISGFDLAAGTRELSRLVRNDGDDEWLSASTSLGLLSVIVRTKFKIYPDSKVYDILDGDIYGMIASYATANLWREFHHRYYDLVPTNASAQEGFQNTFSATDLEGMAARTLLDSGRYLATSNMLEFPSFRPTVGDHTRFNEPFWSSSTSSLAAPHWTKNTREVFAQAVKYIDPDAVREQFNPKGIFRSVIGEAIGVY
ncbi:hypothetical protein QIS74_02708 [Colletotrichum tabaci]|uniref:Uncharacterized protein n=1 Tax=Colletotrichum tabaci TaxID=1209068 RepID=A0AAV9TP44_9PEZI